MKTTSYYIIAAGLIVGLWKLMATAVSMTALPPPEIALAAFGKAIRTTVFWQHFKASAFRVISAMAIAWLAGFPLGVILGFYRKADRVLSPFVFLTYPIPKIVLLPVFLIVFGLGDFSRISIIALIIGFQIVVAVRDGVLGLDRKYIDSFRSLDGNSRQMLRHVVIPAALPYAFTALRIGCGAAVAVLFFVESFATSAGLGYYIMDSWGRIDYPEMFAGIIGMSFLGVVLYEIINYLERSFCYWKMIESGRYRQSESETGPGKKIVVFGKMIKFSHTVFALPFALTAVVLAQREHPLSFNVVFWILVAMIGARSAAMGFNRMVDAAYDARNPRTSNWEIPAGAISKKSAWIFIILSSVLFIFAAGMISTICLLFSAPTLGVLLFYSYTKRFTMYSHLFLGFAISLAPAGAWIAVTGTIDIAIAPLSLALLTYIAGFDILYACQDEDFDRRAGLCSIPASFGPVIAFHVSSVLHLASFIFFFSIYFIFNLGVTYLITLFLIGFLLIIEHKLVRPDNLEHIDVAFFHVNSIISVLVFLGVFGDELIRRFYS